MANKPTLLFVDDEERILKSLKIMFKSRYRILTTTDGNEAIEIAKNEHIHVIISDQRMPIMTGTEVLRAVKEVSPNTMRLLLTGYSDLAAIVGSVNDGEIFRYINKPWDNDEIKSIVARAADISLKAETLQNKAEQKQDAITSELEVLVIDKDEQTLQLVKQILKGKNRIHWGQNLDDSFKILSEHNNIAVIISEIKVGNEDISNPLKLLKQYHPNTLTLVVTSFQDTNALIKLINQGQIFRFLPKPLAKGMLERGIRDALWRYNFLRQVPQAIERHEVEPTKEEDTKTISSKIFGYLKNLNR
jgi:DNA-binding NtrC family response regulator